MDNNKGGFKQGSGAPRGGKPGGKGGYRGGKPGGNGKGGYRGGKPSGNRSGKPGFSGKGGSHGGSGYQKRDNKGGKPRFDKDGKRDFKRSDRRFEGEAKRGERRFDEKRTSERSADGSYKSYRGGDRNRKPNRNFDDRRDNCNNRNNRNNRNFNSSRGGRTFDDRRRGSRTYEGAQGEHRKPNGFAGFDREGGLGGTKSLGYRAGQGKKKRSFSKATPARLLAYEVLSYVREEGCYLSEAVDKFITYSDKPPVERSFARVLATEVVARKGCLDELIDSVLDNPEELEADVRDALRMAFCEVFYLKKPDHVAVDQGVELVRSFAPQAKGLANFALHRAVELKEQFPFGDVETSPKALAMAEGFPVWLAERLVEEMGQEEAQRFMQRSNNPAPLFFMLNLACVDGANALQEMVQRRVKVVPVSKSVDIPLAFPAFGFAERTAVADKYVSKLLSEGALVVSDVAAQSIASIAMPEEKPQRFLEIGAGRGTKTILLQNVALSRFGKQVCIDTLDMDVSRTEERKKHLAQANISQNEVFVKDATNLSSFEAETYDAVFVDAPCSGIGTLRRHPDIRWRMSTEDVDALSKVGLKMLTQAARLVKAGGQLTFATCTVLKQENQDVIDAFLASEEGTGFEVVRMFTTDALSREKVTGPIYDSHFACVLKRAE